MDVAGLSSALANVSTQSQVSTAVLAKAMDTSESLGAGMIEMIDAAAMENSVMPWIGGNFDARI